VCICKSTVFESYLGLRHSLIAALDKLCLLSFPLLLRNLSLECFWRLFPRLLFREKLVSLLRKRGLGGGQTNMPHFVNGAFLQAERPYRMCQE
jgi:hypothetical protein